MDFEMLILVFLSKHTFLPNFGNLQVGTATQNLEHLGIRP